MATFCLVVSALSSACSLAQAPRKRHEPETWSTTDGVKIDPLRASKGRTAVVLFMLTDCPIANAYAPEVSRIIEAYGAKGVSFSIAYVDPGITSEAATKHLRDYGYRCAGVLDPKRTLALRAGATVSPEAIVISPKGVIVYRGRIDDRATGYGKVKPRASRQDLRLTLDAVIAGKSPPKATTPCVGCIISLPSHSRRR